MTVTWGFLRKFLRLSGSCVFVSFAWEKMHLSAGFESLVWELCLEVAQQGCSWKCAAHVDELFFIVLLRCSTFAWIQNYTFAQKSSLICCNLLFTKTLMAPKIKVEFVTKRELSSRLGQTTLHDPAMQAYIWDQLLLMEQVLQFDTLVKHKTWHTFHCVISYLDGWAIIVNICYNRIVVR